MGGFRCVRSGGSQGLPHARQAFRRLATLGSGLTIRTSGRAYRASLNSSVRAHLRDFTRKPAQGERALAVVLSAALCVLLGWSFVFLAFHRMWGTAAVFGALLTITLALFIRAALGARRALNRKQAQVLAWVLLAFGVSGFVIAHLVHGSLTHRLMLLAGSTTLISAGLAGVRRRGQDA